MENVRPSVCDLMLNRTLVMQQDNDLKHTCKSLNGKKKKLNEGVGVAESTTGFKSG